VTDFINKIDLNTEKTVGKKRVKTFLWKRKEYIIFGFRCWHRNRSLFAKNAAKRFERHSKNGSINFEITIEIYLWNSFKTFRGNR